MNQFNKHEKMEKNPLYSLFDMDSFDKDETDALANLFWKLALSMEFLKAVKKNVVKMKMWMLLNYEILCVEDDLVRIEYKVLYRFII